MKLLHAPTSLEQGCYFMNLRAWKWVGEHEQMNKTESFFKYYTQVNKIFEKYLLMPRTKYLTTLKNILPHVHGWTIFMDENVDEKIDGIFYECCQHTIFCKKLNKETRWKKFMFIYFENFVIWNVEIIFQLILYISLIWNIFQLYNI
jgi:hypothetical protein